MIGFSVLLNLLRVKLNWSHWPPCSCLPPPGEGGGGKFHGVDLLQHSQSPSPSLGDPFPHQPRSLEPITDTPHQNLPLRKTHSDLDTTLPAGVCDRETIMWSTAKETRALDLIHFLLMFSYCSHKLPSAKVEKVGKEKKIFFYSLNTHHNVSCNSIGVVRNLELLLAAETHFTA